MMFRSMALNLYASTTSKYLMISKEKKLLMRLSMIRNLIDDLIEKKLKEPCEEESTFLSVYIEELSIKN